MLDWLGLYFYCFFLLYLYTFCNTPFPCCLAWLYIIYYLLLFIFFIFFIINWYLAFGQWLVVCLDILFLDIYHPTVHDLNGANQPFIPKYYTSSSEKDPLSHDIAKSPFLIT